MMKKQLPAVNLEAYRPIAIKQSIDKKSAYTFAGEETTGYPGELMAALKATGFSGNVLLWVYALCFLESGAFSNSLAVKDNNPGSIMYYQGGKRGTYIAANKTYGAHFDNLDAFADKLYRIMSSGARPVDATSLEDFVHRLKLNNYYGSQSEKSYYDSLLAVINRLKLLKELYVKGDAVVQKKTHEEINKKKKKGLAWWQWGLIGVGSLVVLRTVTK
jgi:hypothetical protein